MRKNIGSLDKLIRVVIAFLLGLLNFLKVIEGFTATIFLAFAVYLAVSALLNFSIFYRILGLNTAENK